MLDVATKRNPWPARLKKLRELYGGLSQSEAAARLNIPVKTLQNWEQGVSVPPAAAQALIERTFPEK